MIAPSNIVAFVSSTEGLRQRNRALVMAAVRDQKADGLPTHASITARAGLSAGTVSTVVAELTAEGLLVTAEAEKKGKGRPKTFYAPNPNAARLAHVRITAEAVTFSLIDFAGTLIDQIIERRERTAVSEFSQLLHRGLHRLAERGKVVLSEIDWVLITSKALLNQEDGRILWSPILGGVGVDFDTVFPELKGRVSLRHEASSIAEHALQDASDGRGAQAVLWLGNSIGFGIARREPTGYVSTTAPGLGHMNYRVDGSKCCCGGVGCVEAHAGFHGILCRALDAPGRAGEPPAVPLDQMRRLAEAARRDEHLPMLAFREAGQALGTGLSHLFAVTGVMPLLITGPGVAFFDLLNAPLRQALDRTLLARLGQRVEMSFAAQEEALLLRSAVESCIQDFDSQVIATRRHREIAQPKQDQKTESKRQQGAR